MYYLGKYEVEGKMINTSLDVQHYAGQPYSIFGYGDQFAMGLRSQTNEGGTMSCQEHRQKRARAQDGGRFKKTHRTSIKMEGVVYWCLVDEQNPAAGAGQWQEVICGVAYYRQASVGIDLMTYLYRQKAFVNPASSDELSPLQA